jgi:[acyl-carrier-protein] S-malonyltransferase/trans-AT polyketide synthase/acyltransferase/oxidoreductase domain-containing protein
MGKDFHDDIAVSRQTYEEASDALGYDVAGLCFSEDPKLNLTEYTQPCIVTTEIAMLRGLRERYGFSPTLFGGHSLGEFTSLVAAGVAPLPKILKIVQTRGRLMQTAVPVGIGGMAAVIAANLNVDVMRQALNGLPIDVANVNSAHQVVISGEAASLPDAEKNLQDAIKPGADEKPLRFVTLNVSAPFHSRFMRAIEEPFRQTLKSEAEHLNCEKVENVTSNYTGGFHSASADGIINKLVAQLSNTVLWRDNMNLLASKANAVYEVGPGRPLKDFFKTIGVDCQSITMLSSAEKMFAQDS